MRCFRTLLLGLLVVGVLAGCATTGVTQEEVGLATPQNPEYFAHPYRLVALPLYLGGNILQYGIFEPFYFALNATPKAYGLSLVEQQYLSEREAAWSRTYNSYFSK